MVFHMWVQGLAAMSLAILLPAGARGSDTGTSVNIAPNPSAEQVDKRSHLIGWGHYENTPDEWGPSSDEFHAGRRCAFLKITGFGDDGCACTGLAVGETDGYTAPNGIPVKANTTYHFSFYLAGYGFKRNITVQPWGFKVNGSGRDRSINGTSVLPTPEWKRYVGRFTTKPHTERIALMLFVYGLQERDVEEGATFFVDVVYIGTQEPPQPVASTPLRRIRLPEKAPLIKGEGYKPYKPGTVRIWDANKRYTMKHYDMRAWDNRANWSQVQYDLTDYQFRGDCILEGENFWVSLHSSRYDSVFLYAKTDADATPGRHNELYRAFDTPDGRWTNYGSGSESCKIITNTRHEIEVESGSITYTRKGYETTVVTRYRLRGGKPWLEISPVSQADMQGMHGESRFVLAPEAAEDGSDFVEDSLRHPDNYACRVPNRAKMLLDLIMDDDTMWVLTSRHLPEGTKFERRPTRFSAGNAAGGWHAGWSRIGEGDCDRVWTAPFIQFAGQPVYIGVLRIGYWHYQRVGQNVTKGEPVTLNWRIAYTRQVRSSPFKPGGTWRPLYPGQWRLVACIDGRYHTVPIRVAAAQTACTSTSFDTPATGKLECVLVYFYDRTEQTPKDIWTPSDIYREAVGTE